MWGYHHLTICGDIPTINHVVIFPQVLRADTSQCRSITCVTDVQPAADGAIVPKPATVVWATGFRPGLELVDGVPRDAHGQPDAPRDVVASVPGLYLVGMPFQFGLTSQLLGGVGRDAGYVVERIAERRPVNNHVRESAVKPGP